MPAGVFSKLLGTITSFFTIGISGPGINANGSALETKNNANSVFAVHRGATPVGDNDFATKAYVDKTANKPIPASLQFNGNSSLPSNTSTEQWYVVTTSGANATIGQLLWDDGSNAGTVAVLPAVTGNTIFTTQAFVGGTTSLSATSMYGWSGSAWVNVAPNVSGATYVIRLPITNAASQSSATQMPANAVVLEARLDVVTPYSGGATVTLGITGTAAMFMGTTDNVATIAGLFELDQDTAIGSSPAALLVTVAGSPAAGAGFAIVTYSVPNA
jgi:hypothetical protein